MTLYTNAFPTYSQIGRREDLSDAIYDITPTKTPFISGIAKTSAEQTNHEWQTDSLDANVDTNQQLEGDVVGSVTAATATTRLGNTCEIARKAFAVTGTSEVVNKAGRKSELKYQILKNSRALMRDIETSLLANKAKNAGNSTTARVAAGVESWIATNSSRGTNGDDPAGTGADTATDGTQRALTESLLKSVLKDCFDAGGDPDTILCSSKHKQTISGFTGNATRQKDAMDRTLVASIELYQSDFGDLQIFPHRFMEGSSGGTPGSIRSVLVLQKDMWAFASLRSPAIYDLARTGDAEPRMILAEYTLEARNEAASGIVADLS